MRTIGIVTKTPRSQRLIVRLMPARCFRFTHKFSFLRRRFGDGTRLYGKLAGGCFWNSLVTLSIWRSWLLHMLGDVVVLLSCACIQKGTSSPAGRLGRSS